MDTFENFKLSLTKGEGTEQDKVTLRIDGSPEGSDHSGVWFYCIGNEFHQLCTGGLVKDLAHRCEPSYGYWYFYDLPNEGRGSTYKQTMRVYRMRCDGRAAKIMDRWVRLALRLLVPGESVMLELTMAQRLRLLSRYGQGTGKVKVEMQDETEQALKSWEHDSKFMDCLANIRRIAANSTWTCWQEATVSLFASKRDRDEGYLGWVVRAPNGKTVMNGAVVNHGTTEKPSWSSHT